MTKGFLATLFAAAVSFAGTTAVFAAAPTISGIPDLQIGDMEDNPSGTDNNFFVFTNAFQFSTKATDADTTAGALRWSFSEYYDVGSPYSDTQQQFQINGKDPIAVGATAVAAEQSGGYTNAKNPAATNKLLNQTTDYASFRDILFSPLAQTAPFVPAVTPTQSAYSATVGKNVVFYVADPEGNLDEDIIKVKTKDQDFDKLSSAWEPIYDEGGAAGPFNGWVESGLNSSVADGGAEDVDRTDNTAAVYTTQLAGTPSSGKTELGTIVRTGASRYRILGWTDPTGIPYPGASKFVRGKFYIYTNNSAAAATNAYPNFRARVQHGGAVVGVTNFQHTATGSTGGNGGTFPYSFSDDPSIETLAGQFLKPSRTPAKPSLYRVDFDPVDVPSASALQIVPTFESFAFHDPSNATIMLTQAVLGTFPALTDAQGTEIMSYTRAATAASQGITPAFGAFNAEGNFTKGYKQNLFAVTGGDFATGSEQATVNTTGLTVDTKATNADYTNRFVVGIVDVQPSNNASRPRIAPGKYYRARFHATSDVPTTAAAAGTQRQGIVRFRVQTGQAGAINCYQEFAGDRNTATNGSGAGEPYKTNVVTGQAMPGLNSVNPEIDAALTPAGQDGGWYTVLMPTPLDGDIRRDLDGGSGAVNATTFGTLFSAPGAGSASNSPKDIKTGVDIYTYPINLVIAPIGTINNFSDAQRAKVSVTAVKLFEYDAATVTDDGGYAY